MKINHQHYKEINSTQDQIINDLESGKDTQLISAVMQTAGYGRKGNDWDQYINSISFSLILDVKSLSRKSIIPLAVGTILCKYLNESYQASLKIKWPNDLLNNQGQKVGGIICKLIDNKAIIGIGLNIGRSSSDIKYQTQKGYIKDIDLKVDDYEIIPRNIYSHLISKDLEKELSDFKKNCYHLNKKVTLLDDDQKFTGNFKDIGQYGEAILEIDDEIKKFYSGSLVID